MMNIRNAIIAGACSIGVAFGAMPAQAASPRADTAANTIAGIRYDQIQKVDRRGGWRGGGGYRGGGWGGGGRRYYRGGGRGWAGAYGGGGRRYYGGGRRYGYYGGGRGYYRGGYYGGRRYGYRRDYGGYAAAGILGLATGAIIANSYDRPYYGDGYYRSYGGAECQVIRRGYNRYGEPIRVVRYRPC